MHTMFNDNGNLISNLVTPTTVPYNPTTHVVPNKLVTLIVLLSEMQVHIKMELFHKALSHLKCITIQQKKELGFRNYCFNILLVCLDSINGKLSTKTNNNAHVTNIKSSKQVGDHITKGLLSIVCRIGNIRVR